MFSELVRCHYCRSYLELYYDKHEEIVSQVKCNCLQTKKGVIKPLDQAFKILEVSNEKHHKSSRRISQAIKAN